MYVYFCTDLFVMRHSCWFFNYAQKSADSPALLQCLKLNYCRSEGGKCHCCRVTFFVFSLAHSYCFSKMLHVWLLTDMVKNKGFLPSGHSEIATQRKQIKSIVYSLLPACTEPDLDSGLPFHPHAIIANPPAYGKDSSFYCCFLDY
jgi:hypothetical protein